MNGRKVILSILAVLAALMVCAYIPEDGLPEALAVQYGQADEPTEEEILEYIDAITDVDFEGAGDDDDIAYCFEGECYTWNDVYMSHVPERASESHDQAIHCKAIADNGNIWDPNSGCPQPEWAKMNAYWADFGGTLAALMIIGGGMLSLLVRGMVIDRRSRKKYESPSIKFGLVPTDGSGGAMCDVPQETVAAYGQAVRRDTLAEFRERVAAAEEAIEKEGDIAAAPQEDPERIRVPLWPVES